MTEVSVGPDGTASQAEMRDDYDYPVCPHCRSYSGYITYGADYFYFCKAHRTCWGINTNNAHYPEEYWDHKEVNSLINEYELVQPNYLPDTIFWSLNKHKI